MKKITLLCSLALLGFTSLPINVFASSNIEQENQAQENVQELQLETFPTIELNNNNYSKLENSGITAINTSIEPYGLGPVAVFVAGILAAWIIDGVVVYATGISPSGWVAVGIQAAVNYYNTPAGKNKTTIHVTATGAIMGGGGGSW